jgi:hypothetical protein
MLPLVAAPAQRHYRETRPTRRLHPNRYRAPNVQPWKRAVGTRWPDRPTREHGKAASRPSGNGRTLREQTGRGLRRFVMLSAVLLVLGIVAAWLIVNTLMRRASKP